MWNFPMHCPYNKFWKSSKIFAYIWLVLVLSKFTVCDDNGRTRNSVSKIIGKREAQYERMRGDSRNDLWRNGGYPYNRDSQQKTQFMNLNPNQVNHNQLPLEIDNEQNERDRAEEELQRIEQDKESTPKLVQLPNENNQRRPRTFWQKHEILITMGTVVTIIFLLLTYACFLSRKDKANKRPNPAYFTMYHFTPTTAPQSTYSNYDGDSFRSRTSTSVYTFPNCDSSILNSKQSIGTTV